MTEEQRPYGQKEPEKPDGQENQSGHLDLENQDETKVCADPKCHAGGKPQPIDAYNKTRNNGRMSICKACHSLRLKNGMRRSWGGSKKQDGMSGSVLSVDFSRQPALIEKLDACCAADFRKTADEIFYLVDRRWNEINGKGGDDAEA